MPQRLLSLISNTWNNTHRNISWHIDPKDRPGTALPSRISWKLQPACPVGLGGDRESPLWSHTLGRTRVKALELAGLSRGSAMAGLRLGTHRGLQTNTQPSGSVRKRELKPSLKALHLDFQDKGTVWLLRLPTAVPCSCLSSAGLAPPEASTGAGLAFLAAARGAQEEEQLFSPFFFPRAVPKPCALQSPLPTASPDPKTARAGVWERGRDLLTLSQSVFSTTERRGVKRDSSWKPLQQFRKL